MTTDNNPTPIGAVASDYRRQPEDVGWRPEFGAVLGSLKRYQLPKGGAALDYGCGLGDLTAILARTGYQAIGADMSLTAVRSAQARHPHLAFIALDTGPDIPFANEQFWAVAAANTIEHMAAPADTLRELYRVLKPGGLLAMTFPNLLSPLRPLKRFVARHRRARYGPESGDSTGQAMALLARNVGYLFDSWVRRQPRFRPRQPDFENAERYRLLGYGADYDAMWLCNPLDIVHYLRSLGMHILELRGIASAEDRSTAGNHLRRALPASLSSPILLAARKTF